MVAALTSRKLGRPVNRKRALRVMRERRLLQRHRPLSRRKRPGYFIVKRPDQLWHMDMTSIWVAEHGWSYLNAIVDCCTREIVAWALAALPRRRSDHRRRPGRRRIRDPAGRADARPRQRHRLHRPRFRGRLDELGIPHRRGGYRDPESQAFIESWFGKLKERGSSGCPNTRPSKTPEPGSAGYIDRYHHRPHSRLNYRTPAEVARTWEDQAEHQKQAA